MNIFYLFLYMLFFNSKKIFALLEKKPSFLINVFLWNRYNSSIRLLNSLMKSNYAGNKIDLNIYFEFNFSKKLFNHVKSLDWKHGQKNLFLNLYHYGLEKSIINAWNPSSDKEYAFFFEDDIEVNNNFFLYSIAILRLVQNKSHIAGISLNSPNFDQINIETGIWNSKIIDENKKLFLFQLPNSWGALYFAKHWRLFKQFYKERKYTKQFELIPQTNSNTWDSSWKKYFIEFMVLKKYYLIYPNFPNSKGYSIHHREKGVHIKFEKMRDYYKNDFVENVTHNDFINFYKLKSKIVFPVFSLHHIRTNIADNSKFCDLIIKRYQTILFRQ